MRMPTLAAMTLLAALCGCTTVKVDKVNARQHDLQLVCIEENSEVLVPDLIAVLEEGFRRHGIKTMLYRMSPPAGCDYTLWYTAFRQWDVAPYISRVELRLRAKQDTIASGTYNHSGGLALNKWGSTQAKVDPVIDEMLSDFAKK